MNINIFTNNIYFFKDVNTKICVIIMRAVGFIFLALAHGYRTYYKRVIVDGMDMCVQAKVSDIVGRKMKGTPGTCADIDCDLYKGERSIPFVGLVQGYYCA